MSQRAPDVPEEVKADQGTKQGAGVGLTSQEIVVKLVGELEQLLSREKIAENNYLVERLTQNLEIPFPVLCREHKIRGVTEDQLLVREAISKLGGHMAIRTSAGKDAAELVQLSIPAKTIYFFNNVTTAERQLFEDFVAGFPGSSQIVEREMNDKHSQYKLILANRDVGQAFYAWLDQNRKNYNLSKPLNFKYESEDVYKAIVALNQSRRGYITGTPYGLEAGAGVFNSQGFSYSNYYGGYSKRKCTASGKMRVEVGSYIGAPTLPNFYIRKAQTDEQEAPSASSPQKEVRDGGDRGHYSKPYQRGSKERVHTNDYQHSPGGYRDNGTGDQDQEEFRGSRRGGRGRGGRGSRRGGGYPRGGGHRYQEGDTRPIEKTLRVEIDADSFPGLPQRKASGERDNISARYNKEIMIKIYGELKGKQIIDPSLASAKEVVQSVVNRTGYNNLELVHTSAKPYVEGH